MTRGDTLIPVPAAPERSVAIDVGLFLPGDLVRLSQPGSPDACRLVASVDREAGALVWTLPDLRARRPWEKPLAGFDSSRAIRVERIVHEIVVRESGRVVAIYGELGLHPASRRFISDVLRPVDFEAGGLEVVARSKSFCRSVPPPSCPRQRPTLRPSIKRCRAVVMG